MVKKQDTRTPAEKAHDEQPGAPDPTNAVNRLDADNEERLKRDAEQEKGEEEREDAAAAERAGEPAPEVKDRGKDDPANAAAEKRSKMPVPKDPTNPQPEGAKTRRKPGETDDAAAKRRAYEKVEQSEDPRLTSTTDAGPNVDYVQSKRVNDPIDLNGVPRTRRMDMQPSLDASVDADKAAQKEGETTIVSETIPVQESTTITGMHITPENAPGGDGTEQVTDPKAIRAPQVDDADIKDKQRMKRVPGDHHMDALHADALWTYVNGRKVGRFLAGRATTTELEHLIDSEGLDEADILAFRSDEAGTTVILRPLQGEQAGRRLYAPAPTAAQIYARQSKEIAETGELAMQRPGDIITRPVNPARVGRLVNPDPDDSTFGARK